MVSDVREFGPSYSGKRVIPCSMEDLKSTSLQNVCLTADPFVAVIQKANEQRSCHECDSSPSYFSKKIAE